MYLKKAYNVDFSAGLNAITIIGYICLCSVCVFFFPVHMSLVNNQQEIKTKYRIVSKEG